MLFGAGSNKKAFAFLVIVWFAANLLQALFTDVIPDEAYYYFYSKHLSWGYFDHPPSIALLVKISSLLFNQELGVRLMTVALQPLTLYVTWRIIDDLNPSKKDIYAFFGIAASIVMFAAYGFITTPDSPLLLFTALFLYSYNRFLKDERFANCALMAISMAGLVYSKYQGALVIILVILSNLRLLLNTRFWLSGIAALALLIPHIWWQISNEFPSFKYHTTGRAKPFKIGYFLEYLPNQLATFNPFVLPIVAWVMFMFKPRDLFDRALYFIIGGMILLFWATTFRGHAEPHWTIAASIAMIILLYTKRKESERVKKYLMRFVYPSIGLLVIMRIVLICDFLPFKLEFYNQEKWALSIKSVVGDRAVIFGDGYQKPSRYMLYTGGDALTVNSVYSRQNQYNLGDYDSKFFGRDVAIITDKRDTLAEKYFYMGKDTIYVRFNDHLVLTSKVSIEYNLAEKSVFKRGESKDVSIIMKNNYPLFVPFDDPAYPVTVHAVFIQKDKRFSVACRLAEDVTGIEAGAEIANILSFAIPKEIASGKYKFLVSLKTSPFREGFNSTPISVIVE